MTVVTRESNRVGSLLASTNRVEAPFIRVVIGGYSFGVYEGKTSAKQTSNGVVVTVSEKYPNYIQNMRIKKINGIVNQYTLTIKYPITENNDPNFFEKLLSTESSNRKINITYGDSLMPSYVYKDEEAIITKVTNQFDILGSSITYTIEAVSTSKLTLSGCYMFPTVFKKPSDVIKEKLQATEYHLTDVFTKMKDYDLVVNSGWIADDDKEVRIPTCPNLSIMEYISLLVSYMVPNGSPTDSALTSNIYSLATYEDDEGSYFKVQKIQRAANSLNQLCIYDIDVGYPTANIITRFDLKNNENWSLYYNYSNSLDNSDYLKRINNKGEIEYVYSPQLKNSYYTLTEADATWWTKVTQYPVTVTITLKGLLRPAILMQYVKLNVWFFGHKHISSGYYVVKSQEDAIGLSGYNTTLELLRVSGDDDFVN